MTQTKLPIKLSDHFTYQRLLRFVLSPILMMIFTSIYSVVDGLFVSNFAGKDSFTALNLIYPVVAVLGAVGFMLGAGGTAIVSKTFGEGDKQLANKYFTLLAIVTAVVGVVLAVVGILIIKPLAILLKAEGAILDYAVQYATILLCALPFFMLQNMFQGFFITAEKPKIGFVVTVIAGCANIVLDALFVAVFKWGIVGAAVATAISQCLGGVIPIVYFARPNSSLLRFCKTKWQTRVVFGACVNGSSELLGNISMSLVSMLYNAQLMSIVGNDGVAAFGVVMYVQFIFVAIFIGYCIGTAPIVGYNFGAQNRLELQNVFRKSMKAIAITSVCMVTFGIVLADVIAMIFVSYDSALMTMTARAMRLYSICFAFCGFSMFTSSFFTALNNGVISAVVSFGRTLVFQLLCVFVLPMLLGLDGIWLATPIAEVLSVVLCVVMLIVNNKRYGYVATKNAASSSQEPLQEKQ